MDRINSTHEELAGTIRLFVDSDSTSSDKILLLPQPTESPNDPLNWSYWRRMWSAALVLYITALTAATSNSAGAAGTALVDDYGIGWGVQNTAAGVLFLGIGYSCLALSSANWLYGRRISYIICLIASIIGSAWFARSDSKADTILCQLFLGISESVAEATAQLSLTDVTFQHQRGSVLGVYVLATSVGTFLGPMLSGFIADSPLGWRWMGWFALIISGCTLVVFYFTLEETAFDRDSVLDGLATGRSSAETDMSAEKKTVADPTSVIINDGTNSDHQPRKSNLIPNGNDLVPKSYWQRIALITPSPTLIGTGFKQYMRRTFHTLRIFYFPAVIYSGLQWGMQDAFLSFYMTVEDDNWTSDPYNYGDRADAIMCIPTLIGSIIGCVYGGWFSDVFVRWMAKRRNNVSEAEDRLWLMYLPAIISPIGLILFGMGTQRVWPWPVPYVALGFIGFGFGCGGDLTMAYLMDCYPDAILEGMVGVAVYNNSLACIFTFVCSIWLDAHSLTQVFVTLGCVSFGVMFLGTIIMMRFGKATRRLTANKYKEFLYIRGSV
ncbi:MFS general substrate transporter, partial [Aureobasidium melanogenum]